MSITHFLRLFPEIDETDRHARESSRDTELHQLVKCIAVSVIEPDEHSMDSMFVHGISDYYDKIARHILQDDEMLDTLFKLVKRLRDTYTSFMEYSKFINNLSPVRDHHPEYDDVCCCCHESLDSWRRVVKLKAASGDPDVCGHHIHHMCSKRLKPNESGTISCPMCRTDLGTQVSFWFDSRKPPSF